LAKGECIALRQPTGRLKDKVCSLAYELAATWHKPTFTGVTPVNYQSGFAENDSTILALLYYIFLQTTALKCNVLPSTENTWLTSPLCTLVSRGSVVNWKRNGDL